MIARHYLQTNDSSSQALVEHAKRRLGHVVRDYKLEIFCFFRWYKKDTCEAISQREWKLYSCVECQRKEGVSTKHDGWGVEV